MIYSNEGLGAGCNLLMLHCTDVLQQNDALGQELPRHFTGGATAMPPKAATAGVRHRGS